MSAYPPGAGPTAGAFTGTVWEPPAETATPAPRPLVATQAAALVGGQLVASLTPPPGVAWLVRRITVQNSVPGRAYVYVGALVADNIVSGTVSGEFDENDANQPYLVAEGTAFSVVWAAAGTARFRIEYDEI